jgi:primosomal protein DnaI
MADETFHLNRQTDSDNPMDVGQALDQFMNKKNLHARYAAIQKEVFAEPGIKAFFEQNKDVLTRDIVNRDFAVLYEFYTQVKNAAVGKPVVHRGYKPMLEVTENRIVIVYQPDEETLAAQRLQMQANLVQSIGMPKLIERARLDDFSEDDGDRLAALTAVINFVSAYIADPKAYHRGLYIHGSYGIGKTHLMGAMANELAQEGIPVTLVHFPSFAVEMRGSIDSKENPQDKINAIKRVPILVLDDIGAESITAWIRDDILGVILEYRMQNELPTFFTSNFSMDQLEKEHFTVTKSGAEPVKAERLMQRIHFLAKEIQMAGDNRRVFD